MTVESEFRSRIAGVLKYLDALEELEGKIATPGAGFYRATETITASRASAFIMLYNCVEYAVREVLISIRQEIRSSGVAFVDLHPFWREEVARGTFHDRLNQGSNHAAIIRDIATFPPTAMFGEGDPVKLPFAGNIDHSELLRLAKRLNRSWKPPKSCLGGQDLQVVRKMRNDLAHGTETFEDVGARFSTGDVREKARRVRVFVASLVHSLERYKASGSYAIA